jgi:hypothetical protein
LFELADAQRWWWQRRDLFGRERERRLELRHGLFELFICTSVIECYGMCGEALPARCRPFALRDALLGPLHYDYALGGPRRKSYWRWLGPCR